MKKTTINKMVKYSRVCYERINDDIRCNGRLQHTGEVKTIKTATLFSQSEKIVAILKCNKCGRYAQEEIKT